MKRILALAAVLALAVFAADARAAGSVSQTITKQPGGVSVLTFTCTADSSGGSYPSTATTVPIYGYVFLVVTNPGSTAPTDNYDIVLNDADGIDVMGGMLANRDTSTSEQAVPKIDSTNSIYGPRYVGSTLTLVITNNSVNSAGTVVSVYYTN